MQGFPLGCTPLAMVHWEDGRTLWDELAVLRCVFRPEKTAGISEGETHDEESD